MSALESPLDVLSRAATMVEEESSFKKGCERSSSFKERVPKFRKSSTPEYLRASSSRRRLSSKGTTSNNSPSSEGEMDTTDEEGPLDMSIRKRDRSPPPPYPLNFSSPGSQSTPSSSSSLRDLPPPPSYEVAILKHSPEAVSRLRVSGQFSPPSSEGPNKENEDTRTIREITIITDSCADPLLDEHFRRSLGANYKSLFKKSPVSQEDGENEEDFSGSENDEFKPSSLLSSSARQTDKDEEERVRVIKAEDTERDHIVEMDKEGSTVEDHFAKALGETWIKLQAAAAASDSTVASKSSPSSLSNSGTSNSPPGRRRTNTPQLVTTS